MLSTLFTLAQTATERSSDVVERGEDFAVYQRVSALTDAAGAVTVQTNQFTLLENCLNYFEDGQWKESEDVIETTKDGASATRGPNKAIFSSDLNAPAVFDILTSNGKRLRGGVRVIQLTDIASGKSFILATVKTSAPGELLPPDRIVYADAFDGLKADVLLTWRHNYFSQDVVLREQPALPAGMSPDTTRLEIVSEVVEAPSPEIRKQTVPASKAGALEDDVVINFGRLAFVMGKAFPVTDDVAWTVGGLNPSDDSLPVLKQWQTLPDGRMFLIESIGWTDAQPQLKELPAATQASAMPASKDKTSVDRVWPARPKPLTDAKPMEVARLGYRPNGYVVDFVIIPDSGTPPTLASGVTYYIKTSYYSGSSVTFQPGCFIKFKNNAYMLLYGPIYFPAAGQTMPVFTSRNDDLFGEKIQGVQNELDSDGDPTKHKAAQAIWIYYVNFSTTISDARIRWAQRGIQYDGGSVTHTVSNSAFEQSQTGVYFNLTTGTLNLNSVTKCVVTTPVTVTGEGAVNGSMTDDCGVVTWAAQDSSGDPNKNSQSECSFVVVNSSRIVAAFFDTHLSEYNLGYSSFPGIASPRSTEWALSTDGGATFGDKKVLPRSPLSPSNGDAGDPVMARDNASGTIYLLVNPSREPATWGGFRLWKWTDASQTFSAVNMTVAGPGITQADKPMIAINNFTGLGTSGHLYAAGTGNYNNGPVEVFAMHSADGGVTWTDFQHFGDGVHVQHGADIAIRPDGTVYVFYLAATGSPAYKIKYNWLPPGGTWNGPATVDAHSDSPSIYSTKGNGSGDLKRSNSADNADYFVNNAFPRVAVNPLSGNIYLVYADLPSAVPCTGSPCDRGDVWANEGSGSGSLTWGVARKINNDSTTTDQWNPAVAINPSGTILFIGYYSRQGDPNNNALIKAYGAKANIVNGLASATFSVFSISTTAVFPMSTAAFPPLFAGTSTPAASSWLYDPVWPQAGVYLDSNAVVVSSNPFVTTIDTYIHFMADDYTWATADASYFYFAWCDRSETVKFGSNSRKDANIRLGKITQ